MTLYTLTAYLDDVKIGYGTVLADHDIDYLIHQTNEWFGKDTWNHFKIEYYREAAEND
jgi:hypothetical protein